MSDNKINMVGQMFLSLFTFILGVFFFGVLLTLKISGVYAEVSWFWVCFPLWFSVIISFMVFSILIIINFIIRKNRMLSFESKLHDKSAKQLHHICKKDLGMTDDDIICALEEDDDIRKTLNKKLTVGELIEQNREYIIDYIITCYEELEF